MKHIVKTAVSLIVIFVIGFTAGLALNKYQNTDIEHNNLIEADILSKK